MAVHTPLISSLKGGGRMDPESMNVERKMSKSDPTTSITIPTTEAEVRNRVAGAFCPAKDFRAKKRGPLQAVCLEPFLDQSSPQAMPKPCV